MKFKLFVSGRGEQHPVSRHVPERQRLHISRISAVMEVYVGRRLPVLLWVGWGGGWEPGRSHPNGVGSSLSYTESTVS